MRRTTADAYRVAPRTDECRPRDRARGETRLLWDAVLVPGRDVRVTAPHVLRELEVGAMVPLLRQCGRPCQIHRVFDGDLVTQTSAIGSECQPLDRVLARARGYVHAEPG